MEDLYVSKSERGQGVGTQLVNSVIELAKKQKCYKLIANSRDSRLNVLDFYNHLDFTQHGKEFRLDL